ncbi:hypothetical protein [Pseudoalteromonas luteoviolacea]|uniref:Uncharacterized protein n=1 Tax=Pseudoalteromonas luteoviolacea S4060-1 TaxID=1365257 RepID=A0A167N4Z1_9GAMM|nr:hypothetical protein [Pseudoalteromonas luteoviolacea]KZN67508.1 hypothetical protein N478_01790 [Pseudoalteromonas luteoviolacea S4060-1]
MKSKIQLSSSSKILIVSIVILVAISWLDVLDNLSKEFLNDSITQAGLTFASAKAINASVSVMQSFSVDFGVSISPGEVLDPVNDMVEDFSTLMKYALGSLLLQKLLVEIVSMSYFKVLLTLTAGASILYIFNPVFRLKTFVFKLLVTFVALRFFVVLLVIINSLASQLFLDAKIDKDIVALNTSSSSLSELQGAPNGLPDNIRSDLTRDVKNRQAETSKLTKEVARLDAEIAYSRGELNKLEALYSEVPLKEKYLANTEEVTNLKRAINDAENDIRRLEGNKDRAQNKLEDINDEIKVLSRQLNGETSFFEDIGKAVSGASAQFIKFKNKFSYDALKNIIGDTIDTMLGAMIPFILKTLLLPFLFIVGLLKLFKVIWNIDLGSETQEVTESIINKSKELIDKDKVKSNKSIT